MSSTHGNNEPLPSQQISFIDLDVTEVFHPTLADLFKLLLVDKAQRGVTWGKAPRVTPPDSLKLGHAPTPPRGISQRGCTALAWEGHPERRPRPTPQPKMPHLGEAQPRGPPPCGLCPSGRAQGRRGRRQRCLCSGKGAGRGANKPRAAASPSTWHAAGAPGPRHGGGSSRARPPRWPARAGPRREPGQGWWGCGHANATPSWLSITGPCPDSSQEPNHLALGSALGTGLTAPVTPRRLKRPPNRRHCPRQPLPARLPTSPPAPTQLASTTEQPPLQGHSQACLLREARGTAPAALAAPPSQPPSSAPHMPIAGQCTGCPGDPRQDRGRSRLAQGSRAMACPAWSGQRDT